jgi:peptidoglycan-N-acetylglucosamine deacetylase
MIYVLACAAAVPVLALVLYIALPQGCVWLYRCVAVRRSGRVVCLTFDDGPSPEATPVLLDVLRRHGVRATFFILGRSAEENPGIVQSIARAGHTLGLHGYGHAHPWKTRPDVYLRDLVRGARAIERACAVKKVAFFRPTYGKVNLTTLLYAVFTGRSLVFWTIDPKDYAECSAAKVVESVSRGLERAAGRGGTVLLHDGRIGQRKDGVNCTPEAVDQLCGALRQRGFSLESVQSGRTRTGLHSRDA